MFLVLLSACQTTQSKEDNSFNNILQSSLPWDDTVVISPDDSHEILFDQNQSEDFFTSNENNFDIKDLSAKLRPNQKNIAMLLPLSGRGRSAGQALLNASQMAVFDNADKNFILKIYDTKGTQDGAEEAALDAVNDEASLILGPLFSHSVESVADVADSADIPVIAFSNNNSVANENTFLMGTSPKDQAARITNYAISKGKKRIAIFAPDNKYGRMTAEAVKAAVEKDKNVSITKEVFFPPKTSNFTPLIKKFVNYNRLKSSIERIEERKRENPFEKMGSVYYDFDAIFLPVSSKKLKKIAPLFAYFEVDLNRIKLLGTSLWSDKTLGRDGAISGAWYAGTNPKGKVNFENNYKKLYNKSPLSIASLGFDATSLAALLAKRNISYTPENLNLISKFDGLDGLFSFNPDGTNKRAFSVIEIRRNHHKIIELAPSKL